MLFDIRVQMWLNLLFILVYIDLVDNQRFTPTAAPAWNLFDIGNQECGKPQMAFHRSYYGQETRHGEFPWNAALIHRNSSIGLFCGGTLVSKKMVITAAHCIEGKAGEYLFRPRDFVVILGAHNLSDPFEAGRITAIVKATHIHHDWNPYADSFDADIAILELTRPVYFDEYIQPICLAESATVAESINVGYVVGFGKSERADKEEIARLVKTPILSNRVCGINSTLHQQLMSNNRGFCGGYANGTGVCTGDSGSGLVVEHKGTYYLRGIVSASLGGSIEGCNLDQYSIFTDILGFYGWITTGKNDQILVRELLRKIWGLENNDCGISIIVEGTSYGGTVQRGEYPWNVALKHVKHGDIFCVGTLVSSRHVVTAAHCMKGKHDSHKFGPEDFSVLLGVHNYSYPEEVGRIEATVKSIYVHPDWNTNVNSEDADIAILELKNEVQFTNFIRPICIADLKSEIAHASQGTVVGFGIVTDSSGFKPTSPSDIAKKLEIPIFNYHDCTKESPDHGVLASARTFCGGPADGRGVCYGDSGGGVYVKYNNAFYLRGITAASLTNVIHECDTHKEAIFTDTPKYFNWIKQGGLRNNKSSAGDQPLSMKPRLVQNIQCGSRNFRTGWDGFILLRGEYPWNVALKHVKHGDIFCVGTLVSSRHVVTAAHCMKGKHDSHEFGPEDFSVLLGVHNYSYPEEVGRISTTINSIRIHPDWNTYVYSQDADIAILELTNDVQFNKFIRPICIADDDSIIAQAQKGTVLGFEIVTNVYSNGTSSLSDIAKKLEIQIQNYHSCTKKSEDYEMFASARTFCGVPDFGRGVCSRDSGSGVYVLHNGNFYLRGLVSKILMNRFGECDVSKEAIFTDVTRFYDWINKEIE